MTSVVSDRRKAWRLIKVTFMLIFKKNKEKYCPNKLALYTHGIYSLEECEYKVCREQAEKKYSKKCSCGKIWKHQQTI